ncbi:MAG TPA: tetratricopeptide repeat protein [Thermoanaerobaculia bacterium]|nr:tetratricopeptide repeat protein [Thermoanaerobaculia bacterium]
MSEGGGGGHLFDAYISHAEGDRPWVESHVLPRLRAAGRQVCLDHDLAPGGIQLEERCRAIAASRKTLLVLSEEYLDAGWAMLDEAVARELDPAARKRRLIPVRRDDAPVPLRMRPLVAVDLRRSDEREFQRLVDALDPDREPPPESLPQRLSLQLADATGDLVRPRWNGGGVALLLVAVASALAVALLLSLLLRESPVVLAALQLLVGGPVVALARFLHREDPDFLRRLSHLAAGRRLAWATVALLMAGTGTAWAHYGVEEASRVLCGHWGCLDRDKTSLAVVGFHATDPAAAALSRSLRRVLEQQLSVAEDQLEVLGQDLPQIDQQAMARLRVDYSVVGEIHRDTSTILQAHLYDRRSRPQGRGVEARRPAGELTLASLQALQAQVAESLLVRLGIELTAEQVDRLRATPSASPQALELNDRGFALLRERRWSEAEGKLLAAVALDDGFAIAWSNLAEVAWRTGRMDRALEYRRAAVERLPGYAPLHYNLGHLLAAMGRPQEALAALERCIALDRAHAPAFNEMGNVLLALDEPDRAAGVLRQGLVLAPTFPPLSKNLGRALLEAGDADAAASHLERSLTLYPSADWLGLLEAHALLVDAHRRRGDGERACHHLDEVRRLDPAGVAPFTPDALAAGAACPGTRTEASHA